MSQLHKIVHKIAQNPSQIKEILESLTSTPNGALTQEEQIALSAVLQGGNVVIDLNNGQRLNHYNMSLVELWVCCLQGKNKSS